MMKKIAAFYLATVFLHPMAWAQEPQPAGDATDPTSAQVDAGAVVEQTPKRPTDQPAVPGRYYAGGAIGTVFFRDNSIDNFDLDYDTGSQIAGFGGMRFGMVRAEVELASQYAEFDPSNSRFDGDFNVFRATASLYLDLFTVETGWFKKGMTPYIGGGLGVAVADIEGFDDDDAGFTTHGEVGISFPILDRIDIIPAYRYEWSDFDELDDNQKAHSVRVGARYNF